MQNLKGLLQWLGSWNCTRNMWYLVENSIISIKFDTFSSDHVDTFICFIPLKICLKERYFTIFLPHVSFSYIVVVVLPSKIGLKSQFYRDHQNRFIAFIINYIINFCIQFCSGRFLTHHNVWNCITTSVLGKLLNGLLFVVWQDWCIFQA